MPLNTCYLQSCFFLTASLNNNGHFSGQIDLPFIAFSYFILDTHFARHSKFCNSIIFRKLCPYWFYEIWSSIQELELYIYI